MKEKYYIKFHEYLKDVVKHFQETGSMRHFSELSNKHKCTKITIPLFYEYGLHLVEGEPSRKISDTIRDRIYEDGKKSYNKPTKFKNGDIVAWYNEDGLECIASMRDDGMFSYCLNFEKKGEVFTVGEIPEGVEIVKPSYELLMDFTKYLSEEAIYLSNLFFERQQTLFP